MRKNKNLSLLVILFISAYFSAYNIGYAIDECYRCHSSDVEDRPGLVYSSDVHYKKGVSCADCHGGDKRQDDMDDAMDKRKGFRGVPKNSDIVDICMSCHFNKKKMEDFGSKIPITNLSDYKNGVHGDPDRATCISCHGVHNIKKVTSPSSPVYPLNEVKTCSKCHSDPTFMRKFNPSLPTDQYEKYKTSIHGINNAKGDTKVATCSDCHSSHGIFPPSDPRSSVNVFNIPKTCSECHSHKSYMRRYNIPTDQFEEYSKSVHGKALFEKNDASAPVCNDCHGNHGAVPIGLKSIAHVCGNCHALNAELFAKGPHQKVFEEENIPLCVACHGNHLIVHPDDKMLFDANNKHAGCLKCHEEGDKGYFAAKTMHATIDSVEINMNIANKLLEEAESKGMDVSDARFDMTDIPQFLIKARTMTHTANVDMVNETIIPGKEILEKVKATGYKAIDEFYFRRWGLGASTLIITIFTIALYLKIRDIEKRQKAKKETAEGKK